MDAATEKKVIGTIYDTIYDVVTYSPPGNQPPIADKQTTFLQIAKDMPINPKDFSNAVSPSNPGGLLSSAESFSRFVDAIPVVSADYAATGSIDKIYGDIIQGANATEKPDPDQEANYNAAYNSLYTTKTIKIGTIAKTTAVENDDYTNYLKSQQAYATALAKYRAAYNILDMTTAAGQQKWQAQEPVLASERDQAYTTWRSAKADDIELALQIMSTSINSMVRAVLTQDKKAYSNGSLASVLGSGGAPWHLSYALPGEWCSDAVAASLSEVGIVSNRLHTTFSSDFTAWSGGASWGAGLWSIGGGASGSKTSTQYHMDADNFMLKFKIGVVQVRRPWFDATLFRLGGWKLGAAVGKGGISDGTLVGASNKLLPLTPTHFIIARDVSLSADWSTADMTHIQESISGSVSVGWGPFRASGSYTHTTTKDTFNSTFSGGSLNIPGIQVLAFVSAITPFSPPE